MSRSGKYDKKEWGRFAFARQFIKSQSFNVRSRVGVGAGKETRDRQGPLLLTHRIKSWHGNCKDRTSKLSTVEIGER